MPDFGGVVYVPRKGKCQEAITRRILEKGMDDKINKMVPSSMGKPITETQSKMLFFAYRDLPLVAKLLDFDGVLGIYKEAGIPAAVPEGFASFYDLCKNRSDEDIDKLCQMIKDGQFSEVWWSGLKTPAEKMRALIRLHYPLNRRRNVDFGASTAEANRAYSHVFNALPMDALPDVADTLDVSLRWMLGLDEDAEIFSDRAVVETLYDHYKLLSKNRRTLIIRILEAGERGGAVK